ncbi:MAG: hypothetical protein B6U72_03615 [Candidatus Altiarchaeales archaeon ex4484_2]|nr:MAG: hypothetical protein B6U72_03615 [Candidatus Altiarchaeales archaeon ex4484_2]
MDQGEQKLLLDFLGLYRSKPEGVYYWGGYYLNAMDLWIPFAGVLVLLLSCGFMSPDHLMKDTLVVYMVVVSPMVFTLYKLRLR